MSSPPLVVVWPDDSPTPMQAAQPIQKRDKAVLLVDYEARGAVPTFRSSGSSPRSSSLERDVRVDKM